MPSVEFENLDFEHVILALMLRRDVRKQLRSNLYLLSADSFSDESCRRLFGVLRDARTNLVQGAEGRLGVDVALFGSRQKPPNRFAVVLRNAIAEVVHEANIVLGLGISLLGQRLPQAQRCRVVAVIVSSLPVLEIAGAGCALEPGR